MERQIPDDAVIAVDVGNHAYSFGRYFECKRHTVLMSGYLGSIGFGYPAAMGAWAAAPERPIVARQSTSVSPTPFRERIAWLRGTRIALYAENCRQRSAAHLVADPLSTTGLGYDPINASGRSRFIALQVRRSW